MARNENQKTNDNEGIQITPHEHNHSESDSELCILCEKKPAYKTATIDSDLCKECREGFIRTPFRISGFIAIFLVIAIALSGIMILYTQAPTVTSVVDGYKNISAGDYNTALTGITNAVTQGTMGWKAAGAFADVCRKNNLPDDLTYLVEQFFYDKKADPTLTWQDIAGKANLNSPWNKEIKASYDYILLIDKLANEKSKYFADYYNQFQYGEIEIKDIPYEEIMTKYKTDLKAATTNEEKGIIYYYMLATANICEKDTETQLEYCKAIMQYIPDCYWLYIDNLITFSIQAGEYAEAEKLIATLSTLNNTDALYAKRYTAMMYRYQGRYNESLAILEALLVDIDTNGMYEACYEAMLCELLKENMEKAYEYAIQCVEYEYYLTPDSVNLYALLSKHFGDDEGYTYASEIFAQYGMKISPTVNKYLKGEISFEELFKNGEVVFE